MFSSSMKERREDNEKKGNHKSSSLGDSGEATGELSSGFHLVCVFGLLTARSRDTGRGHRGRKINHVLKKSQAKGRQKGQHGDRESERTG